MDIQNTVAEMQNAMKWNWIKKLNKIDLCKMKRNEMKWQERYEIKWCVIKWNEIK